MCELSRCWSGRYMDVGTRLPGGEGARDKPDKLVVVARATWPSMREACVDFPGSPQPLPDFPSRSLGVHGKAKAGLGQSRFKGRYCLPLWLLDARTLVPSCESAGDLSNEVVILTRAPRRSSGELGVQFPRSSEPRNGLRSHSRSTRRARNTEPLLRIASPLIELVHIHPTGQVLLVRVLCLFQLPFGAPDLLLCDPKRFGRRSRATDGLGAEFA